MRRGARLAVWPGGSAGGRGASVPAAEQLTPRPARARRPHWSVSGPKDKESSTHANGGGGAVKEEAHGLHSPQASVTSALRMISINAIGRQSSFTSRSGGRVSHWGGNKTSRSFKSAGPLGLSWKALQAFMDDFTGQLAGAPRPAAPLRCSTLCCSTLR